jgi:hypothetical protein
MASRTKKKFEKYPIEDKVIHVNVGVKPPSWSWSQYMNMIKYAKMAPQ